MGGTNETEQPARRVRWSVGFFPSFRSSDREVSWRSTLPSLGLQPPFPLLPSAPRLFECTVHPEVFQP